MKQVVIIGNGISGITAARHIRKLSDHHITVISSETEHFFSRTALMYVYMGHMKYEHTKPYEDWFWKKSRINLVKDHVTTVNTGEKKLALASGNNLSYDILVIASGSVSNKPSWKGMHLKGVQALYSYQDLGLMQANTKGVAHAVIVGGGLIGVEMAEMLRSRKIPVTCLVREPEFWSNVLPVQEAALISAHVRSHGVDLRLNTELKEIVADDHGKVKGVVTAQDEHIACAFVGIAVGVTPNITFLAGSHIRTQRGVLVDEFLQTNVNDVYAIGDCVERTYSLPGRKTIEQVWYTGRMMGEVVAQTICDKPARYEPGPWFNSAKFFDIEYQTYGTVRNTLGDDESDFYWEHHTRRKAVHLVWNKITGEFKGINTFGIRMRHALFDQWLRQKRNVGFVLRHLASANFDPEFFVRHENEIVTKFNEQHPQWVKEPV